MSPELCRLFDQHAAAAFDKQLTLAEIVGERDWRFDLTAGVLSFGEGMSWPAQVLGTESEAGGTWLWGWANPSDGLPARLLGSARLLRLLGEERGVPELTGREVSLGEADGHLFALLASGLCRAGGYYRAPYDGGAAFLLLQEVPVPPADLPLARVTSVFPQALASLPISDHRRALAAYLDYLGLDGRPEGDAMVVRQDDSPVMTAGFDELGRLTRLEATLHG